MKYNPIASVWEITMGCNMRCKHCGSSCEEALEGELTTEEALDLCDQLGELGLKWITLSGGEPTTRKDWHLIAKRLRENNVIPNIITNGWLLNEEILDKVVEAGIGTIAISIDGLEETHDFIRKEGSFQRSMSAFDLMKEKGVYSAAITTINKDNIDQLNDLKELFIEKGIKRWQVQVGLPMGNFKENKDMVIDPEQVDEIIDFAYDVSKEGRIIIDLADCLGYYNFKEIEVRKKSAATEGSTGIWQGCTAGKYSFGILHNGDILGCTSIRDKEFIEGNIRDQSLREIWEDENNFKWNREMKKEKLDGLCKICHFGERCLGGCPNTRLVMEGDVHGENKYCSYNIAIQKGREKIDKVSDFEELAVKGRILAEKENFQLAEILVSKALDIKGNDLELMKLYGYISFMLGNYTDSKEVNEKVLAQQSEDVYANKGMGLSLAKLGKLEEGIRFLRKSIELTDESYMDPYYDLAVTLVEHNRKNDAISVLEEGRQASEKFIEQSEQLYNQLIS
ncbi:radical SAM protein with 4Fe4S-binding SPASM domain [Orenia metallireducens]|uniref:Radical SAM additional 4Fe4S-binding SPASM domain-containing protein n=1 Tax=Orenia metallireducens TaxID=1413210 RepID=A0A285IG24_9FIRM|nr:radical SAM protein [Orenia metallireducens]PRX18139.1 radical SAM protein with 4Fe4S-binding SPASM domain [Orenia metallireducens]SNY46925.1 radical SAM additional 4Fe4S-binding SPASM domain-containing protein [Orenia metallireducens]